MGLFESGKKRRTEGVEKSASRIIRAFAVKECEVKVFLSSFPKLQSMSKHCILKQIVWIF